MTIVKVLDDITDWLNKEVCPGITLKMPTEVTEPDGPDYDYRLVHPHAFALFVPSSDKLPPEIQTNIPSMCVQLIEGSDYITQHTRFVDLVLSFSAWDPGLHKEDWINAEKQMDYLDGANGWRSLWNMIDYTVRKIHGTSFIGSVEVCREKEMSFAPFREASRDSRYGTAADNYYPFWFGFYRFTVRCGLTPLNEKSDILTSR